VELPLTLAEERFDWRRFAAVAALAVALQAVIFGGVFTHLWYGVHDVTDIAIYHEYASWMADGAQPYRDFAVEYPPLAIPIFRAVGHTYDITAYTRWFSFEMFLFALATAMVVAAIAVRLWPRDRRAYFAAVFFAVAVAATGAIIENRYDVAVTLIIAAVIGLLLDRQITLAAFVLGLGFSLKLTPVVLLPFVLLFVLKQPRRFILAMLAFTFSAVAPFVPYLFMSPAGVEHVFLYHLDRPLQIESVLGAPLLIAKALGLTQQVAVGYGYGSHYIEANGAHLLASLSGPLSLLAVLVTYALIWRRRETIMSERRYVPLAVFALTVAIMVFGKVFSPQYVIWLLPALALVAVEDQLLGALGFAVLLLTQIEFPSLYGRLVGLKPDVLVLVSVRNIVFVALYAVALWRLANLPPAGDEAEVTPTGSTAAPTNRLYSPHR
jgi:uncharacterized membrane protein